MWSRVWQSIKTHVWVQTLRWVTNKKTSEPRSDVFLSKPQAWYVITRQRAWNRHRRMASPKVYFLRLDSIHPFGMIPYARVASNSMRLCEPIPYIPSGWFHTLALRAVLCRIRLRILCKTLQENKKKSALLLGSKPVKFILSVRLGMNWINIRIFCGDMHNVYIMNAIGLCKR